MDNNTNRPIKPSSTPRPARPESTRLSAEERLKRSIRNLSYTSGASGNLNSGVNKSRTSSKENVTRKKVGGVVLDVDAIQEATNQKLETRGRRNAVIITVLSLLLVVSLVYLAIAIMGYNKGKRQPNCHYVVQGDASAKWIVEDGKHTDFLLEDGLGRDMVYLLDSNLKIDTVESVTINIEIEVLLEGKEILIFGLTGANENLSRLDSTNTFVYQGTITGGGTIKMFDGIDFSEAPIQLNSRNIEIKVTANVNKV